MSLAFLEYRYKKCTINASVQSGGISPISIDVWYRWVSIGASSKEAERKMYAGVLSGPVALCTFVFFNSFSTPLACTYIYLLRRWDCAFSFIWEVCVVI